MRSEKEIFELIIEVANNDERVRAVYIDGSCVNPKVKTDIYQDYDVVFCVTETESFLNQKNWISVFGDIAIVREPDLNDMAYGVEHDFNRSYTWLMLLKDGNRIDLGIRIKEEALEDYLTSKLVMPLIDKDNWLPQLSFPTDQDYWIKEPNELQYTICCNQFWWSLNNVAKGIVRDELSYSMWMLNVTVRDQLVKMLEWNIGVDTGFSVAAGNLSKCFKRYLPNELYEMYSKTYSDSDYNNLWVAVFNMCDLFRIIAMTISEQFGYIYNTSDDTNMIEYLNAIKVNHFSQECSQRGLDTLVSSMDINIQ